MGPLRDSPAAASAPASPPSPRCYTCPPRSRLNGSTAGVAYATGRGDTVQVLALFKDPWPPPEASSAWRHGSGAS